MKYICTLGLATKCDHKKNIKPFVACGYYAECIHQKPVTEEEHGKNLVNMEV